jgi:hypothetical protein
MILHAAVNIAETVPGESCAKDSAKLYLEKTLGAKKYRIFQKNFVIKLLSKLKTSRSALQAEEGDDVASLGI